MITTKIVSSLEKVFLDCKIEQFCALEKISALRGERLSVQLLISNEDGKYTPRMPLKVCKEFEKISSLSLVSSVPVDMPTNIMGCDDNYIRTAPGLYPDVLRPLYYGNSVTSLPGNLISVWVQIDIPKDFPAGIHEFGIDLYDGENTVSATVALDVIAAELPSEDIYFTQWFHADCLANYYNVDTFSEEHWRIIENFVRVARKNGINLLLTPVFTPPLDTAVGGERRTTQLVGITVEGGEYRFDFSKLDRWIDMCDRCGVEYLEISHFFTQWGAAHAPKIMATVDGEYKRIFGWETEATSDEYKHFLRTFVSELLAHLKARGDDKRCFFHISDEPGLLHLENYKAAKQIVADLLDGYYIMDALSKYDFYKEGVVEHPIPANNRVHTFIDGGVTDLWTYYCVSQYKDVSNRYMSMPSYRTRSIGMQMFKYNIKGFLHWGYNFYNNQFSVDPLNPYNDTSAGTGFPAGDAFSVYPAIDGSALESLRIVVFYEALQDIKAMKLCEQYYGHEATVAAIEAIFGKEITFDTCAKTSEMIIAIREKINEMIKTAVNG